MLFSLLCIITKYFCICSYFASSVKATVAETRGVEALVPVNPSIQPLLRSIVVCYQRNKKLIYNYYKSYKYTTTCELMQYYSEPTGLVVSHSQTQLTYYEGKSLYYIASSRASSTWRTGN